MTENNESANETTDENALAENETTATTTDNSRIDFYGAGWCGDCKRDKKVLEGLKVPYNYFDVDTDEAAKAKGIEISGRKNIPVIQFADGTFQVEPSAVELKKKLIELGLIAA